MVDEVSAPVVERPVAAGVLEGVDRHLVEARDDEVVALLGLDHVQVDLGAA